MKKILIFTFFSIIACQKTTHDKSIYERLLKELSSDYPVRLMYWKNASQNYGNLFCGGDPLSLLAGYNYNSIPELKENEDLVIDTTYIYIYRQYLSNQKSTISLSIENLESGSCSMYDRSNYIGWGYCNGIYYEGVRKDQPNSPYSIYSPFNGVDYTKGFKISDVVTIEPKIGTKNFILIGNRGGTSCLSKVRIKSEVQ